jgi:hypothetical protein
MDNSLTAWAQEMAAIAERKTRAQDKRQNTSHLSQTQAEAERERRAKVINAEGEFEAAQQLVNVAFDYQTTPGRTPVTLPPDPHRSRDGK